MALGSSFVASPGISSALHSTSARAMEACRSLRICTTSLGSIRNLACTFRSVSETTRTWNRVYTKPQQNLLRERLVAGRRSETGAPAHLVWWPDIMFLTRPTSRVAIAPVAPPPTALPMSEPMSTPPPAALARARNYRLQKLTAKSAANRSSDHVARTPKIDVLERGSQRVAAECPGDDLDDEIGQHGDTNCSCVKCMA